MIPLNGYVLVRTTATDTKSSGGLYIPPSENNSEGIVERIAEGMEVPFEVGDTVFFKPAAGLVFTKENVKYRVVKFEDDIVGMIKKS
jgi:co-chaperonin GroES (HSP10)